MKILHIIDSLGSGGAERLLLDLLPRLNERGVKADCLVLFNRDFPFLEELRSQGVAVYVLSGDDSSYSPLNIFRLIPFLRKYDLVHVHLFPAQYWVVFAKILSGAGCRLFTTVHGTSSRRRSLKFFKAIDRFVYCRYEKIISVSEMVQRSLCEYLDRNDDSFIIIRNGIDLGRIEHAIPYSSAQLIATESQVKIVLKVAGFREEKDQDTLIRAMPSLSPEVHLLLVGTGVRQSYCEELAERLHVSERVHFLGQRMDVPRILKSADVIVMSSHREGMSLSCLEGMYAGKPFIASDVVGLRELVHDAGRLFPPGDDKTLAAMIRELLDDPEQQSRIANQCHCRAAGYGIEKSVESYLALYRSKPL